MLPIILNSDALAIGLAGAGEGLERRRAFLTQAGVGARMIAADASEAALHGLALLFIAGLGSGVAEKLAGRARAAGVLVNTEDAPALCDFHVPAAIRRGDLLMTVSTGGKAPGLARILREWLGERFGPEWSGRVAEIDNARRDWRAAGETTKTVAQRTRSYVAEKGWLS